MPGIITIIELWLRILADLDSPEDFSLTMIHKADEEARVKKTWQAGDETANLKLEPL